MTNVIRTEGLTEEELALAQFMQGTLNRGARRVYIGAKYYMDYLSDEHEFCSVWELLEETSGEFEGLAVYDYAPGDESINLAATACAASRLLGIPRTLLARVGKYGLSVEFDAANFKGTPAERQRAVWLKFRDRLRRDCLVHQVTEKEGFRNRLRDFSVCRGAFTFFARPDTDEKFLSEVLAWADKNVPVYGWTTDEIEFVAALSRFGDYLIPCDWSFNHSYLYREKPVFLHQKRHYPKCRADEIKHYIAFVVSDGDNVQWLERGFARESVYGQRLRGKKNYKVSWTAAPILTQVCPEALEGIYTQAGKDEFICGVSGIGYTNCMTYPEEYLEEYARRTAEGMSRADMRILALLDNLANLGTDAEKRLETFVAFPNIDGGIWQLDPDRYEAGGGKIFWANEKPFVSVGVSLWHPSGDPKAVTKEWLDEIARKFDARPADIYSEKGYTVVNVHPWTVNMEALDYFVSRLDKHIKIVTAGELVSLVKEYVRKK